MNSLFYNALPFKNNIKWLNFIIASKFFFYQPKRHPSRIAWVSSKFLPYYIIIPPWTYSVSKAYHPYLKFPSLFWHFPIPASSEVPFLHPQTLHGYTHWASQLYPNAHQILQCFRIHAGLCHIGTICMSANMRSNIGHK